MLYQRSPLAARHEYFLDAALDCDEINAFCHTALTLLGDRQQVGEIMDYEVMPRALRARVDACLRLDSYAHQIVADLSPAEQRSFAAAGMLREPLKLLGLAEFLATFNHEDQTTGGAALDFRRYSRCDRNYDPTPRARRRLYSPKAIRRYVKLEDQSVPLARRLAAGLRRLPAAAPTDVDLVNDLIREQRESHRQEYAASRAAFLDEQRQKWGFSTGVAARQRRAVSRAARFAAGLIGPEKVGAFARGQSVTLPGQSFNLEVARRSSIAAIGHSALDVRLCATDGLPLASVCVYFDKTPALDQVAGLAMHMIAGEESTVIETGNLFAITAAGADHPLVKTRLARPPTDDAQQVMDRIARHGLGQSEFDRKRAAQARYRADTLDIYARAVTVQVWGRDGHRLATFGEKLVERAEALEERMAA